MLQHKQQFQPSTQIQECQFPIQQVQIQNCRYLQPSLFNKSSMRCVSITGAQLQQLPEIDPNTQKIDISVNKIRIFPLGFGNLKQIKIDNNYIERLPQEINDMECLRIIKANNNKINIIPFLKNIRHLELSNNPIRLITAKLHDTKLQYLVFDWIPFLVNIYFQSNDQGIIYALCDIIKNSVVDSIQQFVRFDQLFPNRNHSLEVRYLLNKAINKKLDFFIEYLRDFKGNLNYNEMIYNERPILQQVLQQKYAKALQLFKLRKSNINHPEVYITNLVFACRYRNYDFFCFLVENGFKRNIIKDNQMQIIETIFKSFDQNQNSVKMLQKILYLCNFTVHNKKTFYLPRNYSLIQAQNLCEGILYVMNHQHLNSLIDFQHSVSQVSLQPLLHFAMTNRKPELAQLILQRYKKPFVKNYSGKLAKTIRGSVFSRKLVWKYEKKVIKQLFEQQNITKTQIQRRKSVNNQKWFDTVYNQMAIPKLSRKKQLNKSFNYLEGSLISSRIQTMQRSIQERNMFRSLKSSKAQVANQSCSQDLNQIDSTGILYQFALNMNKKSNRLISHNAARKITPQMSNFSLYQLYQKNLQETTERSYKQKSKRMKTINSFSILTPWTLCQQVEDSDGQQQFIQYDRGRKGLCQNSCIDLQDTMMEVERQ